MSDQSTAEETRLKRWRLLLGGNEHDGISVELTDTEMALDRAVSALYDQNTNGSSKGKGSLTASNPNIAKWLGDIRSYFPSSVVKVMQQDALDRYNLRQMLLEPELLAGTEPDVHLVATLIALKSLIPQKTRATARQVVGKVVQELLAKLAGEMRQSVTGAINRSSRKLRPRNNEIDWDRTIRANLKHYQPHYKTVIPERQIGYARRQSSLQDIILCIDQSGSMASSIVYAGVFGSVLASLPAVSTKLVVFDTSVLDLTDQLDEPIDLLFSVQLGGGTDINQALGYCQTIVRRPQETVLVLISDLFEGGSREQMIRRALALVQAGVTVVVLLALSDDGAPSYDHHIASDLAALNIPSFACTPDLFPDLMAAALSKQDLQKWASNRQIVTSRGRE